MFRTQLICLLLVFLLLPSMAVSAADLSIEVDKGNNLATINNTLPNTVTLLFLVNSNQQRLPLFTKLSPEGSAQVKLRFDMPETVNYAVCDIFPPINGLEKAQDNHYHLTVEVH